MRYLIRNLLFIFLLINVTACKTFKLIPEKKDTPEHNFDINLSGDTPMLVLETALPIKFEKSVLEAIGKKPARPEALVNLEEIDQRFKIFENKTSLVKDFILEKK